MASDESQTSLVTTMDDSGVTAAAVMLASWLSSTVRPAGDYWNSSSNSSNNSIISSYGSSGSSSSSSNMSGVDEMAEMDDPIVGIFAFPVVIGLFIVVYSVLWVSCVVGNSLVLAVMTRSPDLNTRTFLFLRHLAVADLSVGLVCIIPNLIVARIAVWIPGPVGTFLCKFYNFFEEFSMTVSVLLLVLIATDRYMIIIHPFKARTLFTRYRMYAALASVWLAAALYNAPLLFIYTTLAVDVAGVRETYCFRDDSDEQPVHMRSYVLLTFLLTYLLPLGVMLTMYIKVSLKLWRANPENLMQGDNASSRGGGGRGAQEDSPPRSQAVKAAESSVEQTGSRRPDSLKIEPSTQLHRDPDQGPNVSATAQPPVTTEGGSVWFDYAYAADDSESRTRSSCTSRTSCSSTAASVSTCNTTVSDNHPALTAEEAAAVLASVADVDHPDGGGGGGGGGPQHRASLAARHPLLLHACRSDPSRHSDEAFRARTARGKFQRRNTLCGHFAPPRAHNNYRNNSHNATTSTTTTTTTTTFNNHTSNSTSNSTTTTTTTGGGRRSSRATPSSEFPMSSSLSSVFFTDWTSSPSSSTAPLLTSPMSTTGGWGGGLAGGDSGGGGGGGGVGVPLLEEQPSLGGAAAASAASAAVGGLPPAPASGGSPRDGVYVLRPRGHATTASCRYRVTSHRVLLGRRKVVKLLIAVLVSFALCVLPFHVRKILRFFMPNDALLDSGLPKYVTMLPKYVTQVLFFLNSALNPVLYSVMLKPFRRRARQVLCCKGDRASARREQHMRAAAFGACEARAHHASLGRRQ